MLELERTYLVKHLPENLESFPMKEIMDLYIENGTNHSDLRLRKRGDTYEITRKVPVLEGDASAQIETTISLTEVEFESLAHSHGKRIEKIRYTYSEGLLTGEIDVFLGALAGLVLVDFEFAAPDAMASFQPPAFCGVEVTHEHFIAGGVLAGKTLEDIKPELARLGHAPILEGDSQSSGENVCNPRL